MDGEIWDTDRSACATESKWYAALQISCLKTQDLMRYSSCFQYENN